MQEVPTTATHGQTSARGIAYGVGAGALWGLVFLAPVLAPQFNGLELAIGRYLAYGLLSLMMIRPRLRSVSSHLKRRDWVALALLALLGNTLYYICLSSAVQMAGIAITSLIIGFLPLAVTIIGSRDHGAVPLRKLALSMTFCAAGIVCIAGQAVTGFSGASGRQWVGIACAAGALVSWTAFAVANSRSLRRLSDVSADDWNLLTGLMAGIQALLLTPVHLILPHAHHTMFEGASFVGVSIGVAVFASIAGNTLWNRMSRLLPLTLVGQMILFETLFALIYGFVWEKRLPTWLEALAFGCVVTSVILCVLAHKATTVPAQGLAGDEGDPLYPNS